MIQHEKMPPVRNSITHRFTIRQGDPLGALKVYVTVGLYEDGRPGEIFLTADKQGTLERGLLHCLALMVSTMLQHGISLAKVADKLKGVKFEPSGLTSNKKIPMVSSVADYLGRWLEQRFIIDQGSEGGDPTSASND